MSIIQQKKQRKFLRSMYQWITLAMLLPLTLFALIAYWNAENAILNNEYQANKKILSQVKFNIDYMNDIILNSIISLYYNSDIQAIMYNNDLDFGETLKEVNTIRASIINTNPFIHSIYFYNAQSKVYYSTLGDLMFKDINLDAMLHSGKVLPTLRPIPRKIEYSVAGDKKRYENVVTYLMYDFKDERNQPNGALIVNASTEWLLNNIKNINVVDEQKQDKVMILDGNGEIVGNNPDEEPFFSSLKSTFQHQQEMNNQAVANQIGYFTSSLNGKKYLITFTYVDKMNWTLVKAQLYDEVFQKINTIKYTFLLITAGFLIIGFITSVVLSRRLYKPIDRLVRQIVSVDDERELRQDKDEFTYLNEAFQHSIDQLNQYKQRKNSEQEVIQAYFLRKLLVDSHSVSAQEFEQAQRDLQIRLDAGRSFVVCIVKIDDYSQFKMKYSSWDQALYLFGIMNIASEWINRDYACNAVEMKNDYIAFMVNADGAPETRAALMEIWKQAQFYIVKYYHIFISICISESSATYKEVSEQHYAALNNSLYRLMYGKSCVITSEMIRSNADNLQLGYSASLEKKLVDALKSGSLSAAEETLEKIFQEIATLNYNNALLSVMNLVNTLKTTVEEISRAKLEPVRVNFNLLTERLFSLETLTELYEYIAHLFRDIVYKTESVENEKQLIVVDTIKELIEADYANPGLCLQYVTDKLSLSPKLVSKLFSSRTNMSVADYINEVRLNKVIDWLENSSLSIKEVLLKIGMDNESYFYKLFKKKFGTTPKEYMLNRNVRQIQNKL